MFKFNWEFNILHLSLSKFYYYFFLSDKFYFIYNLIFCFHITYFHSQNTFLFYCLISTDYHQGRTQ